ncbi:hypothetical protein LNU06_00800 [Campylobacter sp. VicNov18]|nr:hypothetical protein [Campylobacter bilis]MCC8277285.1 hypothetical protein [Campylobacter bilis]MCC8299028.1 hypothetical protein [Campylobacter bilis]MCC8300194.1 hypothetical protein [Campylobacter bilis]MCC8349354.1 hypothetical protein [Campylobacter bilis]
MIVIFIVAFSGITTTESSVRAVHIKTLEKIVSKWYYVVLKDKAIKANILQSLIHLKI